MMKPAIIDQFAKVRALMDSPNPGEAAAAASRYAAMVTKYGQPEEHLKTGKNEDFYIGPGEWEARAAQQRHSAAAAKQLAKWKMEALNAQRSAEEVAATAHEDWLCLEAVIAASYLQRDCGLDLNPNADDWTVTVNGKPTILVDQEIIDLAHSMGWS